MLCVNIYTCICKSTDSELQKISTTRSTDFNITISKEFLITPNCFCNVKTLLVISNLYKEASLFPGIVHKIKLSTFPLLDKRLQRNSTSQLINHQIFYMRATLCLPMLNRSNTFLWSGSQCSVSYVFF